MVLMLVLSCQNDFDEWNDTNQRNITFDINIYSFFDDYLCLSDEDFIKGFSKPLNSLDRIRLSCYCYDMNDSLVQYTYLLSNTITKATIQQRHLLKESKYRFEIFADLVWYDSSVDYYETWYQLGVKDINSFYLFCLQPDSMHYRNIVKHKTIYSTADNNKVVVNLNPITINGYCILSNLQDIEMINGYYGYNESFYINSMFGRKRSIHSYSYFPNKRNRIVIPITTAAINDTISLKIKRIILNDVDSTYIYITNPENKCFVSEIDCKTLIQESCVYY